MTPRQQSSSLVQHAQLRLGRRHEREADGGAEEAARALVAHGESTFSGTSVLQRGGTGRDANEGWSLLWFPGAARRMVGQVFSIAANNLTPTRGW